MENRIFKVRCSAIGKIMSNAKTKGELSQTCKTYLHEWYANEQEEIRSKYLDKGNIVENELIDFMAVKLGLGMAQKNLETKESEYMIGTCDVESDILIVDVKAAWNKKTLYDAALSEIDKDYEWQLRGYMALWDKQIGVVFHGLMDTPAECMWNDEEVIYSNLPDDERWLAYKVDRDQELEQAIIDKVIQCRVYLEEYKNKLINKLNKIN